MTQTDSHVTTQEATTGWTGWITFAAVMLMIGGGLNALYGLLAILNNDFVIWNSEAAIVVNVTTWGWVLLIVGVLVFISGLGLLSGNMMARIVGVLFAGISLIVNFFFIPVYPLWSLIIVAVNALIIWAIMVHGREMKEV